MSLSPKTIKTVGGENHEMNWYLFALSERVPYLISTFPLK